MKASVDAIRAAGFEWPKVDELGRRLVFDGEQIDLEATRAGISSRRSITGTSSTR
jgi:hypothetical protein